MRNIGNISLVVLCFCMASCHTSRPVAGSKFPKEALQKDFIQMRKILEAKHPSLYWYTPKDSMDATFDRYYNSIQDSMPEILYVWHVLAPVIEKIHCGHTSLMLSKNFVAATKNIEMPGIPLFLNVWEDSMAVYATTIKKDSIFKRGTIITSINGHSSKQMIENMFKYLPIDGYNNEINYSRLSNNFPYFHRNIYGLSKNYRVEYINKDGENETVTIPLFAPEKDSTKTKDSIPKTKPKPKKITHKEKMQQLRNLQLDSLNRFAIMTLNTFNEGHLRGFFRRSFKEINNKKIPYLILDIRRNGGGRVSQSTLLTKYISNTNFKVADTVYAISKSTSPFNRYYKNGLLNNLQLLFTTRKKSDGKYHLGYYERKVFKPKKSYHYDGKTLVLTAGPTFSASVVFANAVREQENVKLLGTETGGGWYGNSGIMIPDITLKYTGIRFRLPLFRLVQYQHKDEVKGSGVEPEIYVPFNYKKWVNRIDVKMQTAIKMAVDGKW